MRGSCDIDRNGWPFSVTFWGTTGRCIQVLHPNAKELGLPERLDEQEVTPDNREGVLGFLDKKAVLLNKIYWAANRVGKANLVNPVTVRRLILTRCKPDVDIDAFVQQYISELPQQEVA